MKGYDVLMIFAYMMFYVHLSPHVSKIFGCLDLIQIRSDQISRSVVSNSFWPHESQHARPPCPSPTPGVHPDSCPLSRWCHPAISSSVIPFSSCPQSLPASESFPLDHIHQACNMPIYSLNYKDKWSSWPHMQCDDENWDD